MFKQTTAGYRERRGVGASVAWHLLGSVRIVGSACNEGIALSFPLILCLGLCYYRYGTHQA